MIKWFRGGGWMLVAFLAGVALATVGGYWLLHELGIPIVATVH